MWHSLHWASTPGISDRVEHQPILVDQAESGE
jgi:hypothetical protein